MKNMNNWFDPNKKMPVHYKIVHVKLKNGDVYYGCYCGIGAWGCEGLGRTVMTSDIAGWQELEPDSGPFRDDVWG